MTRKAILCALALVTLWSVPAFAKRRVLTPGVPDRCAHGTIAIFAAPLHFAADDTYVYWIDEFDAKLWRVPKTGSFEDREDLSAELLDWIPLEMVVDDTTIYIGALPASIVFGSTQPGAILTVPKNGGVLSVLVSGVHAPFGITADATHIYWADTGTVNFQSGHVANDGKIERALKNGSSRQTLAQNLSAPLDVLLEGDRVWYGETGLADGDPTVGVYHVAKTGGAVTTVENKTASAEMALTDEAVIVYGGNDTIDNALFAVPRNGSAAKALDIDAAIVGAPQVRGGRAYYVKEGDEANELWSVPIDGSADAVLVRDDLYYLEEFLIDGCAITVGTVMGEIVRF